MVCKNYTVLEDSKLSGLGVLFNFSINSDSSINETI